MPTALIIEDNHLNRKLLRDVLEIRFKVCEAVTAEEALPLVAEHRPDLIITDVQLPGMSGLELTRQLKADPELESIPIVAVSAYAQRENVDEAFQSGCVDYVTKPIVDDPFVLVERFEKIISNA